MQSTLNVGLVGFGYWGPNLMRNLIGCQEIKVVALADSSKEARGRARTAYPNVKSYSDYKEMLRSEKLDALVIASPPSSHAQIAREALLVGCHLLVEKPLGMTMSECERILELAEKKQLKVMVDHTYCYNEAIKLMHEKVQTGQLGNLMYYDSVRINLGKFQSTNVLWDLAPHDVSILLLWLQGKLPSVVSAVGIDHQANGATCVCHATLQYEDGFLAHLHLNWFSPMKLRTIILGGDRCMAVIDENQPSEIVRIYDKGLNVDRRQGDPRVNYRVGDMFSPAVSTREALKNVVYAFYRYIACDETPFSDGKMGLKVIQVLEALQESMENGGRLVYVDRKRLKRVA